MNSQSTYYDWSTISPTNYWASPIARILYITGDKEVSIQLVAAMKKHGHALEIASTAAQGLAMHATESYEVVIHDFHLPDMPGIDVCKKFLLDEPGLPTVIV